VADDRRLLVEFADHLGVVVGDLADRLAGEHLGVLVRFGDRLRVVRPAGGERRVAGRVEHLGPAVPAARQQPQAVDEHDGRAPGRVDAVDVVQRVLRNVGHEQILLSRSSR
jgi:hypothetical protein